MEILEAVNAVNLTPEFEGPWVSSRRASGYINFKKVGSNMGVSDNSGYLVLGSL